MTPCVRIALDKWQQSAVNDVYNSDTKNQGFPQSIDRSHLQFHLQYSKNDPNKLKISDCSLWFASICCNVHFMSTFSLSFIQIDWIQLIAIWFFKLICANPRPPAIYICVEYRDFVRLIHVSTLFGTMINVWRWVHRLGNDISENKREMERNGKKRKKQKWNEMKGWNNNNKQ